jgi:hypothetical protein
MTHLLLLLLLLWDERRSRVRSHEENMQGPHRQGVVQQRSNKEACNMKADWHAAHMSMQDGVAGLPGIVKAPQACLTTLLFQHCCKCTLAERCLHGTRSM